MLAEAAYKDNIGIMEIYKFISSAPPELQQKFQQFVNSGNEQAAWDLVKSYTGVDLQGLGSPPDE